MSYDKEMIERERDELVEQVARIIACNVLDDITRGRAREVITVVVAAIEAATERAAVSLADTTVPKGNLDDIVPEGVIYPTVCMLRLDSDDDFRDDLMKWFKETRKQHP